MTKSVRRREFLKTLGATGLLAGVPRSLAGAPRPAAGASSSADASRSLAWRVGCGERADQDSDV